MCHQWHAAYTYTQTDERTDRKTDIPNHVFLLNQRDAIHRCFCFSPCPTLHCPWTLEYVGTFLFFVPVLPHHTIMLYSDKKKMHPFERLRISFNPNTGSCPACCRARGKAQKRNASRGSGEEGRPGRAAGGPAGSRGAQDGGLATTTPPATATVTAAVAAAVAATFTRQYEFTNQPITVVLSYRLPGMHATTLVKGRRCMRDLQSRTR